LGAGYCDFINNIKAGKKIALDINEKSKDYCSRDVQFFVASAVNLSPISTGSVDVVFASNFLEHFDDIELGEVVGEIYRILKKGGRIILIQPNYYYAYREYFDDYTHKKVFSDKSLSDFLASHEFKKIKIVPRFLPFSFKSRIPRSYWLTRLYLALPIKPMAKQMLLIFEK
jgi:predicted SAM-dependent methyltransferase